MLTLLTALSAAREPAPVLTPEAILGPWCTPGWPACAYDVREDGVWTEATGAVEPWQLDGDVVVFAPGSPDALRWRVHVADEEVIGVELVSTGQRAWFVRQATDIPPHLSAFADRAWTDRAGLDAGTVRWRSRPGESWQTGQLDAPVEGVVAAVRPDEVLLVVEAGGIRVASWTPLAELAPRLVRTLDLAPGVVALPGAPVRQTTAEGKSIAEVAEAGVTASGTLRPGDLSPIYPAIPTDPRRWWLEAGSDGTTLRTAHLVLAGAIPPDLPQHTEAASLPETGPLLLAPGTPLYRGEDIVGVVVAPLRVAAGTSPPEVSVQVALPWGEATFIVRCATIDERPDGPHCVGES